MTSIIDGPILCHLAVALPGVEAGEFMYMPGGLQTINPIDGALQDENKRALPIRVKVDAAGARELERQRSALTAKGKRPYFDFNHEDGPASFWPTEFFWKETPEPGIYCRGDWSSSGEASVKGREWRQFSPVFHVDNKRGNPARIVCRDYAKPNMGGLVNDPAFHQILPLWAKDAGASGDQQTDAEKQTHMNEQEIAALRAKIQGLETEVSALKAKNGDAAALTAKEAELWVAQSQLDAENARKEADALKAKNQQLETEATARRKADAEATVKRAVDRGAIAAKDTKTQEALVAKATDDASFLGVIDALPGNPALQNGMTRERSAIAAREGVVIVGESPNAVMKGFAAVVAKNSKIPLSAETAKEKGALAREAAAIFAKDIDNDPVIATMSMDDAIKAADNSDASVGLLSGTLVLQRALPLMQYNYPILSGITQDFSDAPGLLNQTESTRIILKPAVQTRSTDVDSAGRPVGWNVASPAQSVDVPVKLTDHVGVPIVFGQDILGSTVRNLFAEQAPMALYALGGYAVGLLTALMTSDNFCAYAGNSATGGETTTGSTAIVVTSTAAMYPGQSITGTGIPTNTFVASITDATHAVLTRKATATNTGLTFTLNSSKVPTVYVTYVKPLADFNMAALGEIGAAFDTNEVPLNDRFAMLNASYHQRLAQDPNFNTFFAAIRKPEIITEGALPNLQGFNPMKAPYFPTTSNRVGFAGQKASLVLKSRLPIDITNAVGAAVPGSVTTVSTPGGISVALVQYVSLREGYAEWRPEVMLGAAVGERRCGMVIASA